MKPGTYNFEPMTRGDSFLARPIAELSRAGDPLEVVAARMQVRVAGWGTLLLEWSTAADSISIVGDPVPNTVTLGVKTDSEMADLPTGVHVYDLEVTLADGTVMTLLAGRFPIVPDTSHD